MTRSADDARLLSAADCDALVARIERLARGGGATECDIISWWTGELRWGRNRVTLGSDRRDVSVGVHRRLPGRFGEAIARTNQLDDVSLEATVRAAERSHAEALPNAELSFEPPQPPLPVPSPAIWSDSTFNLTTEARGEVARAVIAPAEAQGLLSAGYVEVLAMSFWHVANRERRYDRFTQTQCSMTVRDSQGMGSGWAGLSSYDWTKIDPSALAERALQKCVASRNPVALEPGRYTVILEPQAVADLLEVFVGSFGRDTPAELGGGPFALSRNEALQIWHSKLGLKVIDERLTLSHNPADPQLGILPEPGQQSVTWIENGVLTNLAYSRNYALEKMLEDFPVRSPHVSYRLSGGQTSVEEMIATTKRGLLVTRFWGIRDPLDGKSLLTTGLTRDGLWLVENGKITKPVKNFRFTESPLFVLNQVEQLGVPVPVFRPGQMWNITPAVVPPLKARDFSFTSMADAI